MTRAQPAGWTIEAVIEQRAIRSVFQPIVHLQTDEIVGFEALARGPEGDALELPLALIEAASGAGLLGPLDWLCRVQAMQTAASSGLHPSLSWFINVEAAGLAIACPDALLPALHRARTGLRVVLEVVERSVEGHVTNLLQAADQARRDAWGVALDDVGADEGSLALLSLIHPDVVKLDMSLLQDNTTSSSARIVAGVGAYAERRGAMILAEGIETKAQERLARVFGATYGQGFLYGRPGPLPDTVRPPRHVVPLRQQPEPLTDATPFEILAAAREPRQAVKSDVLHITEFLEEEAMAARDDGVVLAGFQRAQFFSAAKRERYRQLAEHNALTIVLAEDIAEAAEPRFRIAPLPGGNRMVREWIVIVLGPHYAAAYASRDLGDSGPDSARRFDYVYTHDRDLVVTAARSFLRNLHD